MKKSLTKIFRNIKKDIRRRKAKRESWNNDLFNTSIYNF